MREKLIRLFCRSDELKTIDTMLWCEKYFPVPYYVLLSMKSKLCDLQTSLLLV